MFGVIELAITAKNVAKMDETAQQMSQSTQRAGRIFNGYLTEAQEINTEFARRATETWIEAIRKQTELNQRMVQRLYGEAEGQTGAWQGLVQDWMSVYSAPFYNPFDLFRQGVETATRNVEQVTDMTQKTTAAGIASANGNFPIAGYDEMNVEEASARLEGLSEEQLKRVRDYEKRNKNRDTLIEQTDRKIKAATA
jgi:bisphosphoglycerate-dependent phosphoglycerate mutase